MQLIRGEINALQELISAVRFCRPKNYGDKATIIRGKSMRVLVQQKGNGHYMGKFGLWVCSPSDAIDFKTSSNALSFCRDNNFCEIAEILMQFEDPQFNFVLPVISRRGTS